MSFAVATTLLILAPGPDSLLVMRNTARDGLRGGLCTAAGTLTGLMVWAIAAACGLSALLQASHVAYDILRVAGAAYLIWLGVVSLGVLRRHRSLDTSGSSGSDRRPATGAYCYLNGVVSNLANPKIGVFFIAFLPTFTPAEDASALFSLGLGAWFVAETGVWLAIVVWMVSHGIGWLRRPEVQRWLERATGAVLIGFGVKLASEAG